MLHAVLRAIAGHSMGGHGALVTALRHPGRYRSVSAFSPIVAPSQVPWGEQAFTAYLGEDRAAWKAWDAVALIADAPERLPLRIDQGEADEFLERELRPQLLREACAAAGHRSNCTCGPVTTTATTSLPASSVSTSPGTRGTCAPEGPLTPAMA